MNILTRSHINAFHQAYHQVASTRPDIVPLLECATSLGILDACLHDALAKPDNVVNMEATMQQVLLDAATMVSMQH